MKKIAPLILSAAMTLGSFGVAKAVEIKASGHFDYGFGWVNGQTFEKHDKPDMFQAGQRFRTQIDIIASEQLKGVLFFEIGQINWGREDGIANKVGNGSGGSLGADGINIKTRRAYIEWMAPNTDLTLSVGILGLDLPGVVAGSPVFDDDVAAAVGSYKFNDQFTLTAFWARPFDAAESDGWGNNFHDETDMFGVVAPITLDGATITPWAVYSVIGLYNNGDGRGLISELAGATRGAGRYNTLLDTNTKNANAWWAGLALELSVLDPMNFKFDAMYGSLKANDVFRDTVNGENGKLEVSGWFIDAMLEYKTDFGVPGIFGWYSSGMNSNDVRNGKYNMMPSVSGAYYPTTFGFDGAENDLSYDTILSATGIGMWGIGLQVTDLTFVPDLSHTVRAVYMGGTNAKRAVEAIGGDSIGFLATSENAIEVNFDSKYKIYENLDMFVDLGYINLSYDKDIREDDTMSKNAWKAMTGFRYHF